MTNEVPVLELPGVLVTNTKVTLFGTTYFLRNITSVKVVEHSDIHSAALPVAVLAVIALLIILTQLSKMTVVGGLGATGAVVVALGVAWLMWKYGTKYELILTTGASEQHGLTTPRKEVATRIQAAISIAAENLASRQ